MSQRGRRVVVVVVVVGDVSTAVATNPPILFRAVVVPPLLPSFSISGVDVRITSRRRRLSCLGTLAIDPTPPSVFDRLMISDRIPEF